MGLIILLLNATRPQKRSIKKIAKITSLKPPKHLNSSEFGGMYRVTMAYNKYW